jgi:hypothetical protein
MLSPRHSPVQFPGEPFHGVRVEAQGLADDLREASQPKWRSTGAPRTKVNEFWNTSGAVSGIRMIFR